MRLRLHGIDVSHSRLVELAKLADQARPFYDWVEARARKILKTTESLDSILSNATTENIAKLITSCYAASQEPNVPILIDGVGRSYRHSKGCYYFFSWIVRDAPQQRLGPLITRIVRAGNKKRVETEVEVLAMLISTYRENVKTFSWEAVREVVIDRLEGSRRSIKGHEKEAIVRTALAVSFQKYFKKHGNYGTFAGIEIPETQVEVKSETFDVSVNLLDKNGTLIARMLVPIKTRETEGGGHSHLFTRDVMSALNAVREQGGRDFLTVVIVAKNWSAREADNIREKVDHAIVFDLSPNEFEQFGDAEQRGLDQFVAAVLSGAVQPKVKSGDK
jgi:hypothetical protein